MSSDSMNINRLIEKMQSDDKDYRYMGISDLMNNLGTIQIMDNQAASLCKQLLVMIEDKNTEVQNLVVKCLGKVQTHIKNDQTQIMIKSCSTVVKDGQNKQCDIYATALKEMVSNLQCGSDFSRDLVARDVIPCVLAACAPGIAKEEVRFECLDILADVLLNYGHGVSSQHENVKKCLDPLVKDRNSTVVKKAGSAMGNLLMFCSEALYHRTVEEAIKGVETTTGNTLKTHIGALIFAAKANAQFFKNHIQKVVSILLDKLSKTEDEELMESILHAFEVFIQQCPVHIENFVPQLQKALMKSMVYDPNYDEDGDDDEVTEEKDDDDASDTGYSDDDDIDFSWKARRSAVKALQKLIVQQHGMPSIVKEMAPLLVARFKERDESVNCEVLSAYNTLVKCVRRLKATDTTAHQIAVEELRVHLSAVFKGMDRLLRHKSTQIRTACYDVLSELARTLSNSFSGHMDVVLLAFNSPITDANGTPQLKLHAIRLLTDILESHLPGEFANYVEQFASAVATAVTDVKIYKVSSEAVILTEKLCNFMEMQRDQKSIATLLEAVEQNLASQPVEQEARDRCVNCIGRLVASFGGVLGDKALTASSTLIEYADPKHGSCRCAMQALTGIAKSQSKGVLEGVASQLVDVISAHLTAENRDNKLVALKLLEATLANNVVKDETSSTKAGALLNAVMIVISPADLVVAQSAIGVLAGAHSYLPSQVLPNWDAVMRTVVVLLEGSVDLGGVLNEISALIRAMANTNSFKVAKFETLVDAVSALAFTSNTMSRQAAYSTAVVVAEIALARKQLDKTKELISKISAHFKNPSLSPSTVNFCVSLLGEIGRRYPEVYRGDNNFQYGDLLIKYMDSTVEDVRLTASQALGAMAVGDAALFLPFIAKQIQEKPKFHSLLLNSIKEVICSASTTFSSVTKNQVEDIWRLLESFMDCKDEGVRLIVSECLGRSCILYPDGLPRLLELVTDSRPLARHCALYSFRLIINNKASILDSFLVNNNLGTLLSSLKDVDLLGRRSALYVLNALVHHKRDLIRNHLPEIMPIVYDYLRVRKELIKEVEMGPFKHEIDGGVEVRSVAYQVMFSVLDVCSDSVDMEKYVMHLKPTGSGNNGSEMCGIMDRCHDIRMVSYMMLLRLVDLFPSDLLRMSMEFMDSLKTQLQAKTKSNAVKQDIEKLGELKKMVIKYAYALNKVSGADKCLPLKDLVNISQTVEAEMAKQQ